MKTEDLTVPEVMTVPEVAALSRKSVQTIRNRISKGLDPQPLRRGNRPLLFRRQDVFRWLGLEEQKEAG